MILYFMVVVMQIGNIANEYLEIVVMIGLDNFQREYRLQCSRHAEILVIMCCGYHSYTVNMQLRLLVTLHLDSTK